MVKRVLAKLEAEETETEETKVEETKVEETKVEETKAEETKAEETKAEGNVKRMKRGKMHGRRDLKNWEVTKKTGA